MRFRLWFSVLLFFSSGQLFTAPSLDLEHHRHAKKIAPNTLVKHYCSENQDSHQSYTIPRTQDFPTHIVRLAHDISALHLSCAEVDRQIDEIFIKKLPADKFAYNTYVYCGYDPATNLATNFSINSYIDPTTDTAIDYFKDYLAQYNGSELLGTTLNFEKAKGVIAAITLQAGYKRNPNQTSLKIWQQDHSNFFFKSNYDLRMQFIEDIYNRFYSNDARVVLPFLNQWIYDKAGNIYYHVLQESNYVELQPERIFLMEKEGDIFVSDLRYYFAHQCHHNPNRRCL